MNSIYEDKDPNSLGLAEDLGQEVNGHDELDFSYLFEYDPSLQVEEEDESSLGSAKTNCAPPSMPYPQEEACGPSPYHKSVLEDFVGYGQAEKNNLDPSRMGGPALSPRIEITPSHELYQYVRNSLGAQPLDISPRPMLTVPGYEGVAYREPACLSPGSSNSSTSCHSESCSPWVSPCVSPSNGLTATDLCPRLQGIHANSPYTSPGTSPRGGVADETCPRSRSPSPRPGSRSTSPQGKRSYDTYASPQHTHSPSHHAGHQAGAPPPSGHHGPTSSLTDAMNGLSTSLSGSVPTKMVKTNLDYGVYAPSRPQDGPIAGQQDVRSRSAEEPFFIMPPIWPGQLVPGICSVPVASTPSLEWPLPSRTEHYELRLEVQPRPHHRAHYETEGSRGAVKAPAGGHPVVQLLGYSGQDPLGLQMFIGTADERILKPHAFYQVHRITGKTVTTVCYEKVIHGTKVLEMPLEPKSSMRAVIDCAGILKLRNSDIELRKGETDVGRKNTRVRLMFRVHIPQHGGPPVSLQVASHPIECSQRSAHELPMVERQNVDRCPVPGGQQMILTGQNFTSDSKVVFTEKTHDGHQIWEAEATVDKTKSQSNMLFVEVPPYRGPSVGHAVKVNFFVINGKRKRSQPQHFSYTPLTGPSIKTEPVDDYQSVQMGYAVYPFLGVSPHTYYPGHYKLIHPDGLLVTQKVSSQQAFCGLPTPDAGIQQQNPTVAYSQGGRVLSGSPRPHHQHEMAMLDPPHSMLVPVAPSALPSSVGHHPASLGQLAPSIAQMAATNPMFRAGAPLPEHQHMAFGDGDPQVIATGLRAPVPLAYPTIIQQQLYGQKVPNSRHPQGQTDPQRCPHPEASRPTIPGKVTVKQENLDQAYLDDVNEIIRKDLTVHGEDQS